MSQYKNTSSNKNPPISFQLFKIPALLLLLTFLGGVGAGFFISQTDIIHFSDIPQGWSVAPSLRVCFSPQGHCTEGIVLASLKIIPKSIIS